MTLACARHDCAIPRRHKDGCSNDDCRGCLPALAAPGLRLCDLHTTRISLDALRSAELDHEIELVLATSGIAGERTTGTADHGTVLNERAVEVRREIRAILAAIVRRISEERGIHLPTNNLDAMGAYIATHNIWLAAHSVAADTSDELASLARRAFNAAYPSGARVFPVGPCVEDGCEGTIRVVLRAAESTIPSELVCDTDPHDQGCECGNCPPHRWPYSQTNWRRLGNKIKQRYLTPAEIAERWNMPLGSVYRHASLNRWRRSEDGRRPALYLEEDVRATLDTLATACLTGDLPKDNVTTVGRSS